LRFIPAPAGNAAPRRKTRQWKSVHPRACGERGRPAVPLHRLGGSSPRLRGTHYRSLLPFLGFRFIPAPAGNASRSGWIATKTSVHPRACGERSTPPDCRRIADGSSPRLRGTLAGYRDELDRMRFIPAPAGNAKAVEIYAPPIAVHPRACGERD